MKLATWNVNSIKARLPLVLDWLRTNAPDVLVLQELKGMEFPDESFRELGYACEWVSQKAYNGVAVISRLPMTRGLDRLPGDENDDQARFLDVTISGIRIINIYAPNGNPVESDKFTYKLNWLERLYNFTSSMKKQNEQFLISGDFNIIPEPQDCHDPKAWEGDALFRMESRRALRRMIYLGLTDALAAAAPEGGAYTFWDYQAGAWPANKGIRIDHILLSPALADRFVTCRADREERGREKASDHVPVIVELTP